VSIVDDTDWQVPAHDVALYGEKRHRYALVIPVINEGERIRGQLLRTKAADLPVDVIVADGGSTDGSLDPDFIAGASVRAVLTKTGPGKLSAQLRMAYAWCLTQGYEGIVTIDGNGKDGVEAVAEFVAKLEQGCDYVQGSRYLPGGEAENTPLERTIANRLIHAPLLSLAGRHWFTDTTNGFRAYSARYLTHPEVRPFRDEFQVYGLLFYLTVRAGQLGLKVDHVPVVRRYPDSGKVPTKIGGFASKLALLGETVFAATGGNTPDDSVRPSRSLLWSGLIALLVTLPLFLGVVGNPPYSPDSWSFYELSKTIFGDFYRVDAIRSYASSSPYSSAFPPLYPTLIAVTDGLFGTGARTGLYLAFLSFVAFAMLSEKVGRKVTGAPWIGLAVALVLLLGPKMLVAELEAGRTIPLQLCFYAMVLLGLLEGRAMTVRAAAGIGLAAGLAVLNRFDAAPLPLLAAGVIWWLARQPKLAFASLAASLVAVSPWIVYSLSTFGTVFATDNSGVLTALDPRAYVTDWWPEAQPSLIDDPGAWISRIGGNMAAFVYSGAPLALGSMGVAMATATVVIGALHYLCSRRPDKTSSDQLRPTELVVPAIFAAMVGVMMAPQLLTGYLEHRYFSALFWALFMLAGCWIVTRAASIHQRRVYVAIFALTLMLVVIPLAVQRGFSALGNASGSEFDAARDVAALGHCLNNDRDARVLVLGDDNFAAKAGAIGGLSTMMEPRNLVDGRLDTDDARAFIEAWEVDYVLARSTQRRELALATFDLRPVMDCKGELYRVRR
jgi:glycosyltransferase involved in cell wall biosynthesis